VLQRGYHKDVKNGNANQAANQLITDDTGVAADDAEHYLYYTSWPTCYNAVYVQAVRND
jgi:hypothetical protein